MPPVAALFFIAAAVGGMWWYKNRRSASPQAQLPPQSEPPDEEDSDGPTPGEVPESDIPTVQVHLEKRPDNSAQAVSDDFHVVTEADATGSTQTVIIYYSKLPIDVLVSVPSTFKPPSLVKPGVGTEVLDGEGTRDVLFRVSEFTDVPSLGAHPTSEDQELASFGISADIITGQGNLSGLHFPIWFFVIQMQS